MKPQEGHDFLEAVKAGMPASRDQITRALRATGDLSTYRRRSVPKYANTAAALYAAGDDLPVSQETRPPGTWTSFAALGRAAATPFDGLLA